MDLQNDPYLKKHPIIGILASIFVTLGAAVLIASSKSLFGKSPLATLFGVLVIGGLVLGGFVEAIWLYMYTFRREALQKANKEFEEKWQRDHRDPLAELRKKRMVEDKRKKALKRGDQDEKRN